MATVTGTIGRSDVYRVDPKIIKSVEGWNPRRNWGDLESLKESIKENGVRTPVILRRGKENGDLELIAGERRLRATLQAIEEGAEIVSIPAFIKPANYSQVEALVDAFIENDDVPFDPLSEAEVYRRFVDWGWTQEQVAKRIGRSTGHVNSRLKLLNAGPELREAIQSGEISTTLANQIISKEKNEGEDFQSEVVTKVKEGKKEEVEKKVKRPNKKLFNAMEVAIKDLFGDAKQVVKTYERIHKSGNLPNMMQTEVKEAIKESYELGRISMQAEMLGYSVDDLPDLMKEEVE
jgi:ParB family transcriptional regulator, chromosome partitioning protein